MSTPEGAPIDPRLDRYRPLTAGLQRALVGAALLAALAVVLPDPVGAWSGWALVALLVAAPLVRVAWFVRRWFQRGDPRFALVGLGVLLVVVAGVVLAAVGV